MEQEGEYADDTYIRKVQSMTIQSFKTMDFKAWQDWAKTKYNLGKDFWK